MKRIAQILSSVAVSVIIVIIAFLISAMLAKDKGGTRSLVIEAPRKKGPGPQVGEIWHHDNYDPWETTCTRYRIVDVTNGWVRYELEKYPGQMRIAMTVESFTGWNARLTNGVCPNARPTASAELERLQLPAPAPATRPAGDSLL